MHGGAKIGKATTYALSGAVRGTVSIEKDFRYSFVI